MAVVSNNEVEDGLYVPYHQLGRAGPSGLVGTLHVDATATGAAGGGTVSIVVRMKREEFGFPILWVPTVIALVDNLAAAENAIARYEGAANRRISSTIHQIVTMLQVGTDNIGVVENLTVPIEGITGVDAAIFSGVWDTNTDTKIYHVHMFGPVYDLQMIADQGEIDILAAGVR